MATNGSDVQFLIEDNGVGIHPLALELINERLRAGILDEKQKGYGIYNVNERIKLYFGEQYGLQFESKLGQWTRAALLIPAFGHKELDQYVQNHGN